MESKESTSTSSLNGRYSFVIGVDPAFVLGLSIFDVSKRSFSNSVITIGNDDKTYRFDSYFLRSVEVLNTILDTLLREIKFWENPVCFVLEYPVPRGFSSPILYQLDSLILNALLQLGDVYMASPKRVQSLTSQRKVSASETIRKAKQLVLDNSFIVSSNRISSHEADAMILVAWLLNNLRLIGLNLTSFEAEKWETTFKEKNTRFLHKLFI